MKMEIKQEPTSEGEQEIEATPDLPLECLLCTKSFNSVTGLKVSQTLLVWGPHGSLWLTPLL